MGLPQAVQKREVGYEMGRGSQGGWSEGYEAFVQIGGCKTYGDRCAGGKPFDAKYAKMRTRFERLVEVSQSKGDSETTRQLSPSDSFADFERWNKGNIFGLIATTPEMLRFNYIRSALKLGLQHQAKLGVNPFKFGFIGGSDQHTSLSTTRAENYFGVGQLRNRSPSVGGSYS